MRSIIVTGGSRGIGSEICTTLSKAGYAVAINYNHSAEKALVLCKEIQEQGGTAIAIHGDISDTADVKTSLNKHIEALDTPYATYK